MNCYWPIGIYTVMLCFHFRMYGLFQTVFYFGYMALFSLALGLMCGKYIAVP